MQQTNRQRVGQAGRRRHPGGRKPTGAARASALQLETVASTLRGSLERGGRGWPAAGCPLPGACLGELKTLNSWETSGGLSQRSKSNRVVGLRVGSALAAFRVICRGERRQSWELVHCIPRPCELGGGARPGWPAGTRERPASQGLAVGSAGVADVLSTPTLVRKLPLAQAGVQAS